MRNYQMQGQSLFGCSRVNWKLHVFQRKLGPLNQKLDVTRKLSNRIQLISCHCIAETITFETIRNLMMMLCDLDFNPQFLQKCVLRFLRNFYGSKGVDQEACLWNLILVSWISTEINQEYFRKVKKVKSAFTFTMPNHQCFIRRNTFTYNTVCCDISWVLNYLTPSQENNCASFIRWRSLIMLTQAQIQATALQVCWHIRP